jgi:FMN phosphatase YigB (HAD superfamily)
MVKALLFDLDGTLLPVDTDEFISSYLELLSSKLEKWMEAREFIKKLMESTYAMINNLDPLRTNKSCGKKSST